MTTDAHRVHRSTVITAILLVVLLAALLSWWSYGRAMERRVEDCRHGLLPGSDAWVECSSRGSWFG